MQQAWCSMLKTILIENANCIYRIKNRANHDSQDASGARMDGEATRKPCLGHRQGSGTWFITGKPEDDGEGQSPGVEATLHGWKMLELEQKQVSKQPWFIFSLSSMSYLPSSSSCLDWDTHHSRQAEEEARFLWNAFPFQLQQHMVAPTPEL